MLKDHIIGTSTTSGVKNISNHYLSYSIQDKLVNATANKGRNTITDTTKTSNIIQFYLCVHLTYVIKSNYQQFCSSSMQQIWTLN